MTDWTAAIADAERRIAAERDQARAERDEAIEALRCIAEPINGTPIGDPWAFYADLQALARAILAKHGKTEGEQS